MALTDVQRNALAAEGLTDVSDFDGFDEDTLKEAFKNTRALDPPVPIPAKSSSRLSIASKAYEYYSTIDRIPTPPNMHYTNVLKKFHIEWKAICEAADRDFELKLPVLSKNNPPLKWCDSMKHYLHSKYGSRKIPLDYVIREATQVLPESQDPLQNGQPYGSSGSVLGELVNRASQNHPLFKQDNEEVFTLIEQAARSSSYISTVKTFDRRKDGRGAWRALIQAHISEDKWESICKENSKWLITSKWNGKKFALESFIGMHRTKHEQMREASVNIQFQLPNEHTRVGYLLDAIETDSPQLHAAMAKVDSDPVVRSNFELAAAMLIPKDPFTKNEANKKKVVTFAVSCVDGDGGDSSKTASKNGRGPKTGVDLRWHSPEEFSQLSNAQKAELSTWQKSPEGKKKTGTERNKHFNEKKKRRGGASDGKEVKKLKAQVADLQAKYDEKEKADQNDVRATQIAAAISKTNGRRSNSEEENMSTAREIMGIMARENQE